MKVALIAMPWSLSSQPSAALGALIAYLRAQEPSWTVTGRYEYMTIASRLTFGFYDQVAYCKHDLGELLYMPLLYPDRRESVSEYFRSWSYERDKDFSPQKVGCETWDALFDQFMKLLAKHCDEVIAELRDYDVIGMTTCYGQLFANLALAQRFREQAPNTKILLGGSTVSGRVGTSVLAEYPFVDYVVQGEGERPLLALLRAIDGGTVKVDELRGVLSRQNLERHPNGAEMWEVDRMDDLPLPDYDAYSDACKKHGRDWTLPIEGSRGCWWDRTKRTGNPKNTCYFCNLNVQWGGYREKSIERVVREVDQLTDRYQITTTYFLDNIIRTRGIDTFARALADLEKDLHVFYEMRANVSSYELVLLWEAGLREVQIGIESLSTSYLRRIGKGTTTIQNLLIMKTCYELGITHGGNLITDFPGSTEAEVEETCRTIRDYAMLYTPCRISKFGLAIDSTVDKLREQFGVTNVRNEDIFRHGLPEAVWQRLQLFDLSYDAEAADWSSVKTLCDNWQAAHAPGKESALRYFDGRRFLRIVDQRERNKKIFNLRGQSRAIYLACTETRTFDQLVRRFGKGDEASQERIRATLRHLVERRLMFEENDRYLSLATAPSAQAAARRIRRMHTEDEAAAAAARPAARASLPLVAEQRA